MKAVIMAGGEGTRLRPLTLSVPKPMVNVLNRPMMAHIIALLKQHGITEIAVTLLYLPHIVRDYFGDGSRFGVHLEYFVEEKPLGTAGSVKNAEEFLSEDFLVISGDCLTDINLEKAISFHNRNHAAATIVLSEVKNPSEYGIVVTNEEDRIQRFLEKPSPGEAFSSTVNTGIYLLNKKILSYFEPGSNLDFSKDLFPMILKNKERFFGYRAPGYWCDMGDLKAYLRCHRDLLDGKVHLPLAGIIRDKGVFLEEGAFLEVGATIMPPVYIGKNTYIESGAEIMPYSVIGSSCVISDRVKTASSVIDCGAYLDEGSYTDGAVLGKKVILKENAKIYEGAVIGEETVIGANSIVKPDIKIWPNKLIEDESVVNLSIVNSERLHRKLFGYRGISGTPGVDFTPENIAKLSACFGAMNKMGKLAVACDGHPASYMAKTALTSGAMSSGIKVYDFGQNLLSVVRSAVSFYGLKGAIYVSFRFKKLQIEFLDADGANIDRKTEKALENLMGREDFARVGSHQIESPLFLENYKNYYFKTMFNRFYLNKIDRFIYLKTSSALVDEYCDQLFEEVLIKPVRLKDNVMKNGEITACISEDGERLTLHAEDGSEIRNDKMFMLIILVLMSDRSNGKIVIPPYLSRKAVRLAENNGAEVIVSKNSDSDFMKEMLRQNAQEEFRMCYDAVYALSKIMEYLATKNLRLCDITHNLPEVFKAHRRVRLAQDDRASVMQNLLTQHGNEDLQLLDGIKINKKDGWVFIFPDNKKASFAIITEGINEEYANELCDFYEWELKKQS